VSGLWIKVCGLTTLEAVDAAAEAGVAAVGFVFHADSPRHLDFESAATLAAAVPRGIDKVAVFLHPSQSLIDAAVAAVAPDLVQTDADDFAGLRLPAGVRPLPVLRSGAFAPAPLPARFVYEAARSGVGERADWNAARALAGGSELVLGGGLDPDNVIAAVRAVAPFGVDVSSGVEQARGRKDPRRILAFVAAARRAAATRSEDLQA
jgi:phosphoribosylanthranilate isomerase